MNPILSNPSENGDVYKFTLSGINVSLANALRRTILTDIPTIGILTETTAENQCTIEINTSRLHNEILKQRLSCIPIHIKELDLLPGKYILEVDVKNDTEHLVYVTTEDFRIKNKSSGHYLTKEETHSIFPKCITTNSYIDFARLRAKISDTIPGEHIKLSADFSVVTAKHNSMYNVVSKCSYGNTMDVDKVKSDWDKIEKKLLSEEMTAEEIDIQKKNYYILDSQRMYLEDSFDYVIETVGVFENREILKTACRILFEKMVGNEKTGAVGLVQLIDSELIDIHLSETTMENSFDIILENEDYTIGKVVEYIMYETYFKKEAVLSFCGFKKFHPHNSNGTMRIAYKDVTSKNAVRAHLRHVCILASEVFQKMYGLF
jgi:DNA-directed RNA polymerase subunit L